MRLFKRRKKINLALQGGGAHGAFTWGVLDRLLEEERFEPSWISAASAGAINAVALADGMAEGGRAGAQAKLRQVWEGVHKAGVPDLLRANPFLSGLVRAASLAHVPGVWSPYDLNPLGFDPLRRLLDETINFERVKRSNKVELLISATDVATGRARLFQRPELSIDVVLASTCLPTLHHAAEIEGRAYWDGGFSANPDLLTLVAKSPVRDTLIVLLSPLVQHGLPTGAREIAAHINRITFNAPLMRDVMVIEELRDAVRHQGGYPIASALGLLRHRFHLIEAGKYTSELSEESKIKVDWGLFTYLHGAGRTQMEIWLSRHRRDIGQRETVDLRHHFLEQDGPAAPLPDLPETVSDAAAQSPEPAKAARQGGGKEVASSKS